MALGITQRLRTSIGPIIAIAGISVLFVVRPSIETYEPNITNTVNATMDALSNITQYATCTNRLNKNEDWYWNIDTCYDEFYNIVRAIWTIHVASSLVLHGLASMIFSLNFSPSLGVKGSLIAFVVFIIFGVLPALILGAITSTFIGAFYFYGNKFLTLAEACVWGISMTVLHGFFGFSKDLSFQ
eukprot:m.76405 g.76405  ORF g.76405 m.76405 type:complete len:185 (+) comp24894_c0_seq1:339-893(+)